MYPNLYYFFKDVFGIQLSGLKFVNSFGFFVALSFILAAYFLTKELKRKESEGLVGFEEAKILVGSGPNWGGVILNAVFGFIFGFKLIGILLNKDVAIADPQSYILSGQGSVWAGILLAIALGVWKWWEGQKEKLAKPEQRTIRIWAHDRVGDMTIFAAIFGFGGAKIFHNLENWDDFVKHPLESWISFSGLTFYGGLICAGIAIIWYARRHKIGLWHLVDAFGPAMMIAYAVGRIGCQVAGDGDWGILNSAYISNADGKVVLADSATYQKAIANNIGFYQASFHGVKEIKQVGDVPHATFKAPAFIPNWMVAYPYPHNVNGEGIKLANCNADAQDRERFCSYLPVPVFPTPFYETVVGLLLFLALWAIRKKNKIPGVFFGIYLIMNGVERFLAETIRVNTEYDFGSFHPTQAELISSALALAGLVIIVYQKKKILPSPPK
jgi:prolipoprotein diacylglyceryltransferase